MSVFASILRTVYKISGTKKAFALPEDALRKEIEKQNRHRGVFTPTDRKAHCETITVDGFCGLQQAVLEEADAQGVCTGETRLRQMARLRDVGCAL